MDTSIILKVIDSNNFTVGGGAASAVAGAMAAGMISMVARLCMKKPEYDYTQDEYQMLAEQADQLAKELMNGANEDEQAFLLIKAAFVLAKESDEQKAVRKMAINSAAIQAAAVPVKNGERCLRVYQLGKQLEGNSNPACLSDLKSALFLSESGVKGCILNIEANLPLVKEDTKIAEFQEKIEVLHAGL